MFGKIIFTQFKMAIRSKKYMFWTMAFPLLLGTLFYFAFGSVYENNMKSDSIPVVIEIEDSALKEIPGIEDRESLPFIQMIEELEYEDGTAIIKETAVTGHEEAEKLLTDGEIAGIITIRGIDDISLRIKDNGRNESMLSGIISEYKLQADSIMNGAPIKSLEFIEAKGMAGDNKDPFIAYFYNLIAMVCIQGAVAAMNVIVNSQANQTTTGIRIDSSPVKKVIFELGQLIAVAIMQLIIITIALIYFIFILKLKFGGNLLLVFLTSYLASIIGVSLGFMFAHFGNMSQSKKESILMVFVLGGGFLSGLMVANMKVIIEQHAPWFNRINPSAVITDAFYSLNVFGVGDRYYRSVAYMVILSLAMLIIGCLLSRRTSYKSL